MQKKNGEIDEFKLLVFITETAIKAPIKYAPLSPKNIWAFGKLNFNKIKFNKIIQNRKYVRLVSLKYKLIKNKVVKIINEWIHKRPLNPSIKFEPLTINKKHKQININAKMSIAIKLSKKSNPVFLIWVSLNKTNTIRNKVIIINLSFGAIFTFKSSAKPKIKKNVQNKIYSRDKKFLAKYKYKKTKINNEK